MSHEKKTALELIDQIIQLENIKDFEHRKLLADKHVYHHGESVVAHSLKILKELVEKL